ncbi:Endoplasmic reticulum mannosyl-oligosaccharide 1,2-alpha-mannosidase [Leucoagaricus sp. SymC.cos]|nr:Endoplasmic reticulum mannosyl-oligosaccharide 1,2-alpha-mannosidase [Leucoagaricus sp. SymC.cos]
MSFLFYPFGPSRPIVHHRPYQSESGNRPQQYAPHRPYPPPPRPPVNIDTSNPWEARAQKVREAFLYAWDGYKRHAAGWDELTPVDGGRVNNFNGWGVTLFDALDTMWLMDLRDEFRDALEYVAKTNFTLTENEYVPFFETVIRYLGGLLSAYALSGEPVLLSRADDLGRMLLPAFDTPSGLPKYAVNTVNGKTRTGWTSNVLWSEALSNQLEYKFLAHLTGRTEYFVKTENIMKLMYKANILTGLYPTMWSMESGSPNSAHYTVGAFADSAHEYLLKQYLLTARSEPQILELYLNSINGVINNLLYITPNRHLLYVTDTTSGITTHKLEHLSCFFPGLLALGVDSPSYTETQKQLHQWAAEGLAETCWLMYADQKTGLSPEEVRMEDYSNYGSAAKEKEQEGLWVNQIEKWMKEGRTGGVPPGVPPPGQVFKRQHNKKDRDYRAMRNEYLLRPETIETFFYMWKLTGDPKWRERGWSVLEAIEKYAKTKYGYASLLDIDSEKPDYKNEMPSFFLAETLKYLYLLFKEDVVVPLDQWVFNTEAHPLPIFDWSPWEKQEYNITV